MREIGDAQHEADGIKNVGLAGAVEAGDGIEFAVKALDLDPISVRLESI